MPSVAMRKLLRGLGVPVTAPRCPPAAGRCVRTEPSPATILTGDLSGLDLAALMIDGVHHLCVTHWVEGSPAPSALLLRSEATTKNTPWSRTCSWSAGRAREMGQEVTGPVTPTSSRPLHHTTNQPPASLPCGLVGSVG